MMRQDDTEIIACILDGNVRLYSVLVDRHRDLAFTIAYRLLGNRMDAEEVVQDAFVKAYRGLKGFRHDARFSTWLFRIVYNTAVSKRRLKRHNFQSIDELSPLPDVLAKTSIDDDHDEEREIMLEKALVRLTEDERALVTMFYLHEASVDEIHFITGLTRSNVKVKLFRARKKLQEFVGIMAERIYI